MMRARLLPILWLIACAACSEDPSGADDVGADRVSPMDADDTGRVEDTGVAADAGEPDAMTDDAGSEDGNDLDATDQDASGDAATSDADAADADPLDGDQTDGDPMDGGDMDADETDADSMDAQDMDAQDMDAQDPDATVDAGSTISALNDEFDDAMTLVDWTLRNVAEGTPAQYGTLDIDTTTPGFLTIIPSQTAMWQNADRGIFMYKQVTGDFIMRTNLRAVRASNTNMSPQQQFNAGGVMARDPASPTIGENWSLVTLGYQVNTIGPRDAQAINSVTQVSNTRASFRSDGQVILCRIGPNFYTYYITPAKGVWTRTNWQVHLNMPATVQVGIAVDAGGPQPHLRAEFDWIRFAVPTQESDCTMDIPPN